MHTILGAGGVIANELLAELKKSSEKVRLVSRQGKKQEGANEALAVDLLDAQHLVQAVAGSKIVYLLAGLPYDAAYWAETWPKIMNNTIEACKRAKAKLIFFDNVYMYGLVKGPMTEATPYNPCSKKGEVRAKIASHLLQEVKDGKITACIARCADFYGPAAKNSVLNMLAFAKFASKAKASCLVNDSVAHSYTFTPDAGKCLALLAKSEGAWNQTWHVPTASAALTDREYLELIARQFGVDCRYGILNRPLITLAGLFVKEIRESKEMLYQYQCSYVFDSSKYEKSFGHLPTSYAEGIRLTAASYRAS